MRAIVVLFDSLNRKWMPAYGGNPENYPNFARLEQRTATFDQSWVCSMPCMPARRDFHTGRPNFTHTGWCPLQPFDESMPAMLVDHGVSTHLVTDHYHYFEDGGGTYHNRYSSWQFFRGQEGDPWKGQVAPPQIPANVNTKGRDQDWVNRQFWKDKGDWSQVQTFDAGVDFLERNRGQDNWLLQIETFDPHEPFVAPQDHQSRYPRAGEEPVFDWPGYGKVEHSAEEIQRLRDNYSSLVSLCDEQLGRILDLMDRDDMWQDTMLVVCTDHGFLLGEHDLCGKGFGIMWDEIGHTPLHIWDPRTPQAAGQRRSTLVQPMLDLPPTLLNFFGSAPTPNMTGFDLAPIMESDQTLRDVAVMGHFTQPINVTDGRYFYTRAAHNPDAVFHSYTSMPTRMRGFLSPDDLQGAEVVDSLPFSNGLPVIRYPRSGTSRSHDCGDLLFDLVDDPNQQQPLQDEAITNRLAMAAQDVLKVSHTPTEYLHRFGW